MGADALGDSNMGETGQQAAADERLPAEPAAGESVLLCAPSMDHSEDELCTHFLQVADHQQLHFLGVLLDESPDDALERWRDYGGGLPGQIALVTAGDQMRSAAAASGGEMVSFGSNVKATSISEPGDLTGLGIKTSQCLSAWSETEDPVVVCFRSLTTLLQYADIQKVFQFLHVLTQRIRTADARAHFHIDPNAHTDQEMATLESLFDRVYRYTPDGEWTSG